MNGRSSPVFDHLVAGNYNLVIQDNEGCTNEVKNIIIADPDPITLRTALVSNVSCADVTNGRITLSVTGGFPPYTYSIPGYTAQSDSVFRQLDAGQYQYRITDSHGCSVEGDVTITKEWRGCAVFVPNAFSPNRDGINDLFRTKVNDEVSNFRMAIYGRWGQLVFETYDPERGWDGKQKGVDQPTGSYLYVITFTDSKAQLRKEQGTVLLIR